MFKNHLIDKYNKYKASINKKIQLPIEIANKYQSLHVGCNHYGEVDSQLYKEVKKSHEEVKEYAQFFKKELGYHRVIDITDKFEMSQIGLRENIIK